MPQSSAAPMPFFFRAIAPLTQKSHELSMWERSVVGFELKDRASPPRPGGIVFTGSSTVRFWKSLEGDMAPLGVVNRGFGGSLVRHVTHYFARIIVPHAPRAVVLYSGDNDLGLSSYLTPGDVIRDFQALFGEARRSLPESELVVLGIKPSRLRHRRWGEMCEVNAALERMASSEPWLRYIDLAPALLGGGDMVDRSLLRWDGLHLSALGYARVTGLVRPQLLSWFPPDSTSSAAGT
jgi:lysophospholipase L1-like esterase